MDPSVIATRICSLMRRESEAVGFIPRPRVVDHVRRGLFRLQIDQNEIVGYVLHGPPRRRIAVHQVVVDLHARRLGFAHAMIRELGLWATKAGAHSIRLRCRVSLEANAFWLAQGAQLIGTEQGGVKRGKMVHVWRIPVASHHIPLFHY